MLGQSITDTYISKIPWQYNPSLCFCDNENAYKEAFESVIEYTPQVNDRINYNDDIWDFNPLYENINSQDYVLRFQSADNDYKDYLKFFCIYQISRKSKISTIKTRISNFIYLISNIRNDSKNKSISLITNEDIEKAISEKDLSYSRKSSLFTGAHMIFEFITKNYDLDILIDIEKLKEQSAYYKKISKEDGGKMSNIPEEYYKKIVNEAYKALYDESCNYNTRMTAGLIIIASQTGLRRQDLLGIKTTDLKERYLPVSNVKCHYLHFQSRKPSKAHSDMLEFDVYASDLCAEVFNKMLQIREKNKDRNQPYLYVVEHQTNQCDYPVATYFLNKEYQKFFYEKLKDEVTQTWEGIAPTLTIFKREREPINIPTISQFRVHLATSLYNNGISLVYIQKYLGHLSEYMLGYYVRPKDKGPENAVYAENIVKKIVTDDATPLGHMGKELKENLIKFVEKGNYNVSTDIKSIINDLGEKLVIREKAPGLCCIKTSIIPCKHDARTNETLCAYGLCPNIFHFYDMIEVTYMNFKALQETYQSNLDNGYTRAAQKELNKIKDFIKRRFKPEAIELKKTLDKNGIEKFCSEHPDLRFIATNIDNIFKEIEVWENY